MEQLIALLFLARDIAHRRHLTVTGVGAYAAHEALGAFYEGIIPLADRLAEAYQGRHGVMDEIPRLPDDDTERVEQVLRRHVEWIERNRADVCPRADTALHNIIDEIVALYLTTVYKLVNLK